jgi:tetratricopeptide (TPR) repeat protein
MRLNGKRLPIRLAAISLLLLLPVLATAEENWTRIQSRNFTVIGNTSEQQLRKTAANLELFRQVIERLIPSVKSASAVPTIVIVFKSQSSYDPFKPLYKGKIKQQIGGYFMPGIDRNYITLTTETYSTDPYRVVYHELAHSLIGHQLPNVPVWLNEGIAEFYSTFDVIDEGRQFRIGRPIVEHLHVLQRYPALPLKTFLAVDQGSPHYNEATKSGIFYAQSWAFVHYLLLGEHGKRQPQLIQFLKGLNTELSLEENFKQSFGVDYRRIETELGSYILRNSYPVMDYKFDNPLEIDKQMRVVPMQESEVQYYKGDLLLRLNRQKEAEAALQKSIELDANSAESRIAMGLLRGRQNRPAEAKELFQRAIELDPRNYLGHYYYARQLSREGKVEEAVKSYRQALALRPDMANINAELAFIHYEAGREKEGDQALSQAIRLDPTNAPFYQSSAFTFLDQAHGIAAAKAALVYLTLKGWRDTHSQYMSLVAHFGFRQANRAADAEKYLDAALARCDSAAWPYPVLKYLKRTMTAEQLIQASTDNDKLTESHAYIGLDLSLSGHPTEALPHLEWVKKNGNKEFYEYPLALAELGRITGHTEPDTKKEGEGREN